MKRRASASGGCWKLQASVSARQGGRYDRRLRWQSPRTVDTSIELILLCRGRPRHHHPARRRRPRQHRMAARPGCHPSAPRRAGHYLVATGQSGLLLRSFNSSMGLPVTTERTDSHWMVTMRDVWMPRADGRVLRVNPLLSATNARGGCRAPGEASVRESCRGRPPGSGTNSGSSRTGPLRSAQRRSRAEIYDLGSGPAGRACGRARPRDR